MGSNPAAPTIQLGRPVTGLSGRLAQLAERLLYTQDVGGSIPSPPTSLCTKASRGGADRVESQLQVCEIREQGLEPGLRG